MRFVGKHKWLVLIGLILPTLVGAGRWIQLHTPPSGLPEILKALSYPDPEFVEFLKANREIAQISMPELYRLRRDNSIWEFSHMRRTGDQAQAVVRSSGGQTACLILHSSRGRLPTPSVWRYIRGETLGQMADSALDVTRAPGIVIGYWRNGREVVEARGVENLRTHRPMEPGSRFKVHGDYGLLQMAVARLAEKGTVPWNTAAAPLLRLDDFPVFAKDWTLERFTFGPIRGEDWPYVPYDPKPDEPFAMNRKKLVEASIAALHSPKRSEVPKGEMAVPPTTAIVAMALEAALGKPCHSIIEEHVFKPLQMGDASFEARAATSYEGDQPSGWSVYPHVIDDHQTTPSFAPKEAKSTFYHTMLHRDPVGLSVRDLLALGRFRLQADQGTSSFLNPNTLKRTEVRPSSYYPDHVWQLGWLRGGSEDARVWSMEFREPGVTVAVVAFPRQNAVLVVAANFQLGSSEYMGGILARIADRFCDVQY